MKVRFQLMAECNFSGETVCALIATFDKYPQDEEIEKLVKEWISGHKKFYMYHAYVRKIYTLS